MIYSITIVCQDNGSVITRVQLHYLVIKSKFLFSYIQTSSDNSSYMNMLSKRFASLLIIISSIGWKINGLKILGIFALTSKSHFLPGEALLKEMAYRGHSVDVVSHFPQKKIINNYNDISLVGSAPILVNNATFEGAKRYNAFELDFMIETLGYEICDLLGHSAFEGLLMKTPKGTYDVIIVESFATPCYFAFGQHLGAPVVGLVASKMLDWLYEPFGIPLYTSYIPSWFSNSAQRMTFWERLQNTLLTHAVNYKISYYFNHEIKQVEKYFNRKLSSLNELYNDVSLMLVNEHFTFNDVKPVTPDIIEIGGLHIHGNDEKLPPDLQKWLDESTEGCVYMTFGSMVGIETMPEKLLKFFYETFERIAPVRVLLKIAKADELPDGLPKNVKISSWMPQIAVLKHNNTKAFITHGGQLSTQEAVVCKVPMIGIPLFADQLTNIQTYVHRKIAIVLSIDTLTPDSLTNAVNSILKDPIYRENINRISDLFMDRPMSAMETAIYWIEYTARHGTVIKSPATQLNWWQLNLIDVYAFILIFFLVIISVLKSLFIFIRKFMRNNVSRIISKSKKRE